MSLKGDAFDHGVDVYNFFRAAIYVADDVDDFVHAGYRLRSHHACRLGQFAGAAAVIGVLPRRRGELFNARADLLQC